MSARALLAVTTLGNAADALALVRTLLNDRLVACGTVLPGATSLYRWDGRLVEEGEVVVLLKTNETQWEALAAAIQARHPYDVPELLAFPVDRGLEPYLQWVAAEVTP